MVRLEMPLLAACMNRENLHYTSLLLFRHVTLRASKATKTSNAFAQVGPGRSAANARLKIWGSQ